MAGDVSTGQELLCQEIAAADTTDRITLVGLIMESAAGLRRRLGPSMENEVGVSGQAFEILIRLRRSPGNTMRMADLAAQTALSPSGLTRALDRLVEAGLSVRELCPSDRRGTFAQLTDAGRAKVDDVLMQHRLEIDDLLGDALSPEEEQQLLELLRRVRDRVHPRAALLTSD